MTERESLLQTVMEGPADDMARLVYADWLEENGTPEDQRQVEFIRVGVELAKTPEVLRPIMSVYSIRETLTGNDEMGRYTAKLNQAYFELQRREHALMPERHVRYVFRDDLRDARHVARHSGEGWPHREPQPDEIATFELEYRRGFAWRVEVDPINIVHLPIILIQHPIEKIYIRGDRQTRYANVELTIIRDANRWDVFAARSADRDDRVMGPAVFYGRWNTRSDLIAKLPESLTHQRSGAQEVADAIEAALPGRLALPSRR